MLYSKTQISRGIGVCYLNTPILLLMLYSKTQISRGIGVCYLNTPILLLMLYSKTQISRGIQKKLWAVEKIEDWWLNKIYSPDSNYVLGVIKPRFEKLCFTI
jgi:hypothetical protein